MKKDKLRSILDDMDQGYGKRDTNDDLRKQIWEAQREAAKKALSSIFGIKPEEKAKMDALLEKHGYNVWEIWAICKRCCRGWGIDRLVERSVGALV